MGETSTAGTAQRTYVYRDETPVAQIDHGGAIKVTYLTSDHLDTPVLGTDPTKKVVWRWDHDAYGSAAANSNPTNDGNLTVVNLRFPGQYYEQETGLHYNHHRYYDPKTGRYLQSDPIGLQNSGWREHIIVVS